jgi:hypothetical protein
VYDDTIYNFCARARFAGCTYLRNIILALNTVYTETSSLKTVKKPQRKCMFMNSAWDKKEFSSLIFTVTFISEFYSPPPTQPPSKIGLKLVCNGNIVYGNLKSENSQDYAQKPQQNCTFIISALGQKS